MVLTILSYIGSQEEQLERMNVYFNEVSARTVADLSDDTE